MFFYSLNPYHRNAPFLSIYGSLLFIFNLSQKTFQYIINIEQVFLTQHGQRGLTWLFSQKFDKEWIWWSLIDSLHQKPRDKPQFSSAECVSLDYEKFLHPSSNFFFLYLLQVKVDACMLWLPFSRIHHCLYKTPITTLIKVI